MVSFYFSRQLDKRQNEGGIVNHIKKNMNFFPKFG